jgi:hypothetical protein
VSGFQQFHGSTKIAQEEAMKPRSLARSVASVVAVTVFVVSFGITMANMQEAQADTSSTDPYAGVSRTVIVENSAAI